MAEDKKSEDGLHLDDYGREIEGHENHEFADENHELGPEPKDFKFGPFTGPIGLVPVEYHTPPDDVIEEATQMLLDSGFEDSHPVADELSGHFKDYFAKNMRAEYQGSKAGKG